MVEYELPKLVMRVRFPLSAYIKIRYYAVFWRSTLFLCNCVTKRIKDCKKKHEPTGEMSFSCDVFPRFTERRCSTVN